MIWCTEHPLRWRQERQALEGLIARVDWLRPYEWRIDEHARLNWDADILVNDQTFPVSLRYPNHFPHSPPLVLPRGVSERWSSHQYGAGGELCLEFGPDNWHPDMTGADMMESAFRLLQGERPAREQRGVVASRHATTLGQDLFGKVFRWVITRELATIVPLIGERLLYTGTVIVSFPSRSARYVIDSIETPTGAKWTDNSLPREELIDDGYQRPVAIYRLAADAPAVSLENKGAFYASLAALGYPVSDADYALIASGEELTGYYLTDESVRTITTIPAEPPADRLTGDYAVLAQRKVAVVGCGSLGSKLAIMLARAGVGKFLLVDDDILLPGNLVRNDLDWSEIGLHKVDGVARRIHLVNPSAQCDQRKHRLGGQQSSGSVEALIESLAACDLIVDASADARVFTYLCAAAASGKKAMLWAEVFGGGVGGYIARHRPGLEPAPVTIRDIIDKWCRDQGKPLPRAAEGYEALKDGVPFIADDADVSVIAAHAARLATDTLIPRAPSLFPYSVYMIGLAQGLYWHAPFDVRPIDVGPVPEVAEAPVDPQIAQEEAAKVVALIVKYANEAAAGTNDDQAPPG